MVSQGKKTMDKGKRRRASAYRSCLLPLPFACCLLACGCAGLENQKGGLKRRFTFIKQLRDQGWIVEPMDLGGQAKRFGKQAEMKFEFALRALMAMKYLILTRRPTPWRRRPTDLRPNS